jgi:hypothetical protein
MGAGRAQLSLLTIATIFVVVFAFIYGGVQYANGELLPPDTTTEAEYSLRDAVWEELNDRREARGLAPMPHDRFVRGTAQDTTDTLAAEWAPGTEPTLTNHRLFCTQVPARVDLAISTPTDEAAVAVADGLAAADRTETLSRPPAQFRAGMGIARENGTVYVVYRSCEQVDT